MQNYHIAFEATNGDRVGLGNYNSVGYPAKEALDSLARKKLSPYIKGTELLGRFVTQLVTGVELPAGDPAAAPLDHAS